MSRRLVAILIVALLCQAGLAAVQWNAKLVEQPSDAPLSVFGSFNFNDSRLVCCISLVIFNRTDYPVTIVWDESSIVLPWGESSRVVLGSTRLIHSGLPQPPTVVPPGSHTAVDVWPEKKIGSTSVFPIDLKHGDKIRLYLAWQSQEQKGFSYWEWVFERIGQEASLGIGFGVMWLWPYSSLWKEEMPTFLPWAFFGRFTENSFLGVNLFLGISYRGYFGDIQRATNVYWGIGTWVFILPYVEAGVSFLRENLAVEIGLIWYLPYTNILLRF